VSAKAWAPIRKILAAAITAVIAGGGLIAFVTTGEGDWRAILGVALAAALPVIVGYLTPPDVRQGVQAPAKARAGRKST
jgi:multidrug efflux pump subunit AcrA (membrane-fusion protein)